MRRTLHNMSSCPVCIGLQYREHPDWANIDEGYGVDFVAERCMFYPEMGHFRFREQMWENPDGTLVPLHLVALPERLDA